MATTSTHPHIPSIDLTTATFDATGDTEDSILATSLLSPQPSTAISILTASNLDATPSPTLSARSSVRFVTSIALRENKPELSAGLSSLGLLASSPGSSHRRRHSSATATTTLSAADFSSGAADPRNLGSPDTLEDEALEDEGQRALAHIARGEFLYKYTRRRLRRVGFSGRGHSRYVWVHPFTRTLHWRRTDLGSPNVARDKAKTAYVKGVRSVLDPVPHRSPQYNIVISTARRDLKFAAPTKERHDVWMKALQYLLSFPLGTVPEDPMAALMAGANSRDLPQWVKPVLTSARRRRRSDRSDYASGFLSMESSVVGGGGDVEREGGGAGVVDG